MKKALLVLVVLYSQILFAQKEISSKEADLKFKNGDYESALTDYLKLFKDDPKSEEYNYRIGVCYLNSNVNKVKAIPYLENVTKREHFDNNALYLLGRAYHYAYRFDDASRAYNRFKDVGKGTSENLKDVEKQIQYCFNSKEVIKFPVNVTFQNLGRNINSSYADYYPFVSSDEAFIIYNSLRPDAGSFIKPDGNYPPSAYRSEIKSGFFSKSENISKNFDVPDGEEEVVGMSPDGSILLIYHDDFKGKSNIYAMHIDSAKKYSDPVKLDGQVNTSHHEIAASINNEGDILYFASDRSGGKGGTDIYVTKKLPTGEWGVPQNLGEPINSAANEDFPNISPDGKTLYFSSNGHTSMGGYDIFKSTWDEKSQRWVNLKNLGYPINTPYDNMNFRISSNGRYGYISALRSGGQGDLDIYRVTFNEVEHNYVVIKGIVNPKEANVNKPFSYKKINIKVVDNSKKDLYGLYQANPINGRYIIIVPPGNYDIEVSHEGFVTDKYTVDIPVKIIQDSEINKDFYLPVDGAATTTQSNGN
ncbi:MAG: PD40 domain-containing protein [Bacteroidetes bacterium]|nr:PD40 domain-containing protein [Bacteroidota bacterium]